MLYVLREEAVPVEQLREGDLLILPGGARVTVERVDEYDHGYVVRWWRRAERGEPGFPRPHVVPVVDEYNGRFYGSTKPHKAGEMCTVDRA